MGGEKARAALATAPAVDGETALWIASPFADYLIIRGRFGEARQWLAQALVQLLRLDFYQTQRTLVADP